jgi:hypothetical protein
MPAVAYLRWVGIGALLVAAVWLLSRRLRSGALRLALRCLAVAAAVTPQPLWIPGEGGAVMPALALLISSGISPFAAAMGAFPILAGAGLVFIVSGQGIARRAVGGERLVHQVVRRWVLMGLVLPWLVLAVTAPFLAYFALGGPIAIWGTASLVLLAGAALLDGRAARAGPGRPGRWIARATWVHAVGLALAVAAWTLTRGGVAW